MGRSASIQCSLCLCIFITWVRPPVVVSEAGDATCKYFQKSSHAVHRKRCLAGPSSNENAVEEALRFFTFACKSGTPNPAARVRSCPVIHVQQKYVGCH